MPNVIELENMTDEELNALNTLIDSIKKKRDDEKRTTLVNNFKKAYEALLNNGYDIIYCNDEYDEAINLVNWDCFTFFY